MTHAATPTLTLKQVRSRKRRTPRFSLDGIFSGFFMYFGVSGTEKPRQEYLRSRFASDYYGYEVNLRLTGASGLTGPGPFVLEPVGLTETPSDLNGQGWTLQPSRGAPGTYDAVGYVTLLGQEQWQRLSEMRDLQVRVVPQGR
ncbi:hypothetical protein [Deinococcus maricopensis]|uniref:Uncharacterized protein n=1 Tax=Deinococcus maricopensis (strain DSM 21211 / LMG 22137 / NRRL B-23946 / LB-34) TaxID=709986 RepID=E8U3B1_DEIML|nr:hypothetical protein [Deinococcus maricopensis]ADV65782.1 hypothetical protein Deima_0118 [Deinococcus maricopensis DSM 21211]